MGWMWAWMMSWEAVRHVGHETLSGFLFVTVFWLPGGYLMGLWMWTRLPKRSS